MRSFDVVVAGSGPAGAASALRLARAGYSVALIDERDFPRHKVCGEYVNLGAIQELRDIGLADDLAPYAAQLHGMRLFAHGESAAFPFTSEAWSLPRVVLDDHVRGCALNAGAQAVKARVRSVDDRGSSVVVTLSRDGEASTLEARFVVAADGMRSVIARQLGLTKHGDGRRFATGGHYKTSVVPDWVEMYASPNGYLAINPLSSASVNAMFVLHSDQLRRHRNDLPDELARFSASASGGRHVLREQQLIEDRASIGPLTHVTSSPVQGRVLLVGDAARFVDPFTGQGVYLALVGARLASSAIAKAFANESARTSLFQAYATNLTTRFRERERIALMMRIMIGSRLLSHRAARALRRRPLDFVPLIDAVCGNVQMPIVQLAGAIGAALR